MPRLGLERHETRARVIHPRSLLLVALLILIAATACGDEDSLTGDLAGPPDLPREALFDGPPAPPWLAGGDPVSLLAPALDAAGIAGATRQKVDALVETFKQEHAAEIAGLAAASAQARAEAVAGRAPDRERWRELLAAEKLEPGALRDDMMQLRRSIASVLTPEQSEKLRAAWRAGRPGRLAGSGRHHRADLALTADQEREIQRLVTDFGAKHQDEIQALRGAIREHKRGPGAGRGPGFDQGMKDGAGPHGGRGGGPGAEHGDSGLALRPEWKEALTRAGHDPDAFTKDLGRLNDQARAVLTADQKAKLDGRGLHLLRRLLFVAAP